MIPTKAEAAVALKLNSTKLVLDKGQNYQLKVTNSKRTPVWTVEDTSIARVNKNGVVQGIQTGRTKVTATLCGKKVSCIVVVADLSRMSKEQRNIVKYALNCVGNKYRYGGSSLVNGTDCSGFTMAVYGRYGVNLPHNTNSQLATTKQISIKDIKPGDLIFYGSSKWNCTHVAMYIGDGKVVHASNERNGITISNYNYRKRVGIGRILTTETY